MTTLLAVIGFLFSATIADAQEDLSTGCIKTSEIKEISKSFSQFSRYTNTDQKEVCSSEMGSDNYQILASLQLLKNASPNEPSIDKDDAFTSRAIEKKNWWKYFTNRSQTLVVDNSCQEAVAYVYGSSNDGVVYLCRPYFESNRSTQASVLMHEARHFDGHGHVTCERGRAQGNHGACDNRVTEKGSYAISLQTLVGLSRDEKTPKDERLLLESEAIYTAFNRFNQVPQLKLNNYIYLSNDKAEVFRWNVNSESEAVKVAQLDQPAIIQNSYNKFTMYPLDTNFKAYRTDMAFSKKAASPGLYAVHFNTLSPEERAEYDSIVYFGDGALLADNQLQTFCNNKDLVTDDLDRINDFSKIITLTDSVGDPVLKTYLLAKSGEVYTLNCQSRRSKEVDIRKTRLKIDLKVASSLLESFTLSGEQFALLSDGRLIGLSLKGDSLVEQEVNLPMVNEGFVGATPLSVAEIFESDSN